VNNYLYDGEGRICAIQSLTTGAMTGYVYDPDGIRVAKGTISSFNCTNSSSNGFSATKGYVVGLDGEQLTETNSTGGWNHTNVFAGGQLLATYGGSDTYYAFSDWLGTKRAEHGVGGCLSTWLSLPFGSALQAAGNCPDATEHHYTGKERDGESGNDYFGARYYASTMGRFMSPDPSGLVYVDPANPQSLNLYGYGLNNPLTNIDPTGLSCVQADDGTPGDDGDGKGCEAAGIAPSNHPDDDPNQFDPYNINVNPPPPGQNLEYDAQVSYDQLWLQTQKPQSGTPDMYLQAIAKATAPIPNVCSGGVNFSFGKISASASLGPGNVGYGGFQFSGSLGKQPLGSSTSQNEGDMNYNSLFPILPSPVNVHYSAGGNIVSANTSSNISIKGRKIGVSGFINISNFGDPNCQ
jgi:RHS repeat-associated protein